MFVKLECLTGVRFHGLIAVRPERRSTMTTPVPFTLRTFLTTTALFRRSTHRC